MATSEAERRASLIYLATGDDREAVARAAKNIWFFARNLIWVTHPDHPDQPVRPWDFQRPFLAAMVGEARDWPSSSPIYPHSLNADGHLWDLIVDKSREVGATWWALACILHQWLYGPVADYGVMTRSGPEVDNGTAQSLFGKLDYMLSMLPPWLRPRIRRVHKPQPALINEETGAAIIGSMTVPDAFRGGRLRRCLIDEAGVVPRLDDVLRSVQEACRAVVLISTPPKRPNAFTEIVRGERGPVFEWGSRGLGWLHFRWHYSQRPDRNPATEAGRRWLESAKATKTEEAWRQEQEIDYQVQVPGRIWPEFDERAHVFSADEWRQVVPHLATSEVYEGWDFGEGESLTACVQFAHLQASDTIYCLNYRCWKEAAFDEVAADYRTHLANPLGRPVARRVGDIAGKQRDSSQRSWIANLRSIGLEITGLALPQAQQLRERMRVALRHDRILFSPQCAIRHTRQLPSLTESVRYYHRDQRTDDPRPVKDEFSHLADALQYPVSVVWPTSQSGPIAQARPPK